MSLKDLRYKPPQRTIEVIFDDEVRRELIDATVAVKQYAASDENGLDAGPHNRLEAAEAAAREAAVSFVFEAIPRHKLAEITNAHPPSAEDMNRWREATKAQPYIMTKKGNLVARGVPEFDVLAATPYVIAASLVEPETSEEEILELWEEGDWSDAIWAQLSEAAWGVNDETPTLPTFGNGSKKTLTSVPEPSTQ